MLRASVLLLMLAGLGGAGGLAWFAMRPAPARVAVAPPPPPPARVALISVPHLISAGTLLRPEDLAGTSTLVAQAPPHAWTDTPANRAALIGAMVRQTIPQGAVVTQPEVIRPGDHGFLSAVLAPGRHAATVMVGPVTGEAGLIWPGDHVDVLLVRSFPNDPLGGHEIATETVLTDVRVIAVNQALIEGTDPGKAAMAPSHTVTLEVSAAGAQVLALASKLGPLSLSLRAADSASAKAPGVTWSGDLATAQGNPVRVFDGPSGAGGAGVQVQEFHF